MRCALCTVLANRDRAFSEFLMMHPMPGNYYLIVEAVDPAGRLVEVEIESEEDRKTQRVSRWAQRVSESAFNAIASDKRDDQIIQNAVIGAKTAGTLSPTYSVATPGGAILEW